MDAMVNLNINQTEAVMDDSQACLVNAQVGSGKTTVLIAKVCYLHQTKGIPLSDMVVLTFTNKAANEIKDRLRTVDTNINETDLAYFGTFHSVALKMLKSLAPLDSIGYSANFAVMDAEEKADMASVLISSNQLNIKYRNKLEKRMEKAVNGNFLYGAMKCPDDMESLWNLYTKEKHTQGKMDFDDLILNITKLLPQITYRPKWIIVDEFQDTDEKQMMFIRALTSSETKLFAVGDPNQSIYSWRGSNQRIFDKFVSEYNARQLSLPENYRSCKTILEVARCFLKTGNELYGIRESGSKIKINKHYNSFHEAQYIASSIQAKVAEGLKYNEIAVFYRLQRQSELIEDVFWRNNIPYEVSLKKTIKDIPVLRWVILLLRASVNPLDLESAVAVLSDEHFGERFSKTIARKLVASARNAANSSVIAPKTNISCDTADTSVSTAESTLLSRIDSFENWCKENSDIEAVYDYFSFDLHINPTSVSFQENKESILALLKKMAEYIKTMKVDLFTGIKNFVNSSALYGINVLMEDVRSDTDTVKLMTLHSAKGLEFKQVYIIGVNNGLIPLFAKDNEDEQEERRLFFVGITRAKDSLELSYYTSPDETRIVPGPSRYLSCIPAHLVDIEDIVQQNIDLQTIRREVAASKNDHSAIEDKKTNEPAWLKTVRHPKYGIGSVVKEDDNMITVAFDGYGEKELMKVFSELEDVGTT